MSTAPTRGGVSGAASPDAPDRIPDPLPPGPSSPWTPPVTEPPVPDVAGCEHPTAHAIRDAADRALGVVRGGLGISTPVSDSRRPASNRAERRREPKRSPLAILLDEACEWIDRLLILPSPHARDLFALWAAATWARTGGVPVWSMLARLVIISDDPASAKSTALRIVMALSCKGESFEDPSGPALLQKISEDQITGGIDELDLIIENRGGGSQMLRTILNGGVYPEGKIPRFGHPDTSSFGWIALCGLAQAYRSHPRLRALRTRGIPVEMFAATEQQLNGIEEYDRAIHLPQLRATGQALGFHVSRLSRELQQMERLADVPRGVVAREREKWRPLLAVAQVASKDWAERARAACRWATKGDSDDDTPRLSPRQQIVADMERVMMGEPFVRTLVILQRLAELGYPFVTGDPDTSVGAKLNQAAGSELSRTLGGYLSPTKRRVDGRPVQGYLLEDVTELREAIVPAIDDGNDEDVPDDDDGQDVAAVAYEDVDPADALIA